MNSIARDIPYGSVGVWARIEAGKMADAGNKERRCRLFIAHLLGVRAES
jgi:hypothetical protein